MKLKADEECMRGFSSVMVEEDVVAGTQIEKEARMAWLGVARLDESASACA